MKLCKFCKEEVQDEAIKCKHCGSQIGSALKGAGAGTGGLAGFAAGSFGGCFGGGMGLVLGFGLYMVSPPVGWFVMGFSVLLAVGFPVLGAFAGAAEGAEGSEGKPSSVDLSKNAPPWITWLIAALGLGFCAWLAYTVNG